MSVYIFVSFRVYVFVLAPVPVFVYFLRAWELAGPFTIRAQKCCEEWLHESGGGGGAAELPGTALLTRADLEPKAKVAGTPTKSQMYKQTSKAAYKKDLKSQREAAEADASGDEAPDEASDESEEDEEGEGRS